MKLNKKYLIESILEVMGDDSLTPRSDFEKLMSALTSDLSNARQAWEMYDLGAYELSPEEEAEAKQAAARVIVTDSDNPGKDLQEIGFDFHQVFEQHFGFSPPRTKKFRLWGGKGRNEELSLRTKVIGKEVEFEFWRDRAKGLMVPWFRFETMHGMDGYVTFEKGVISIDEGDDYSRRSSKERLPGDLRSAMGIAWEATLSQWPELPKGQAPAEGPEGTDYPVYEAKDDKPSAMSREEEDEIIANIKAFYKGVKNTGIKPMTGDQVVSRTNATSHGSSKFNAWRRGSGSAYKKNEKLNRGNLYKMIAEVLMEEEDEEDIFQMASSKLNAFISTPDIENFRSGWNLLEAMAGLMDDDEENKLKDRLLVALMKHNILKGNEDLAIDIVDSVSPKEERLEFEEYLFNQLRSIGNYELAASNALKDLEVDVKAMGDELMLMTGIFSQEQLEKAKARLIKYGEPEEHFEVDTETGGLLVGPMAKEFATFEKKIKEIFGVAPSGDIDVGYEAMEGLTLAARYPRTVEAPMVHNKEVKVSILFEYSRLTGFGMELTLIPVANPHNTLDDYYGIWVSQWDEGPNIGKLEIGIQSFEDELEDNRNVRKDDGSSGFTIEEMHEEIYNLTGVDLDEVE